LILFGVVDFR